MPDTGGLVVGLMSIAALAVLYRYADALSDGNIDRKD